LIAASAVAVLVSGLGMSVANGAPLWTKKGATDPSLVKEGKKLAFNRKKGNCVACHQMDDGNLPGNIGPPLVAMKSRFPDQAKLRAQIWDATKANPNTMMPPFGKHNILSESDIDKIAAYVHTL